MWDVLFRVIWPKGITQFYSLKLFIYLSRSTIYEWKWNSPITELGCFFPMISNMDIIPRGGTTQNGTGGYLNFCQSDRVGIFAYDPVQTRELDDIIRCHQTYGGYYPGSGRVLIKRLC